MLEYAILLFTAPHTPEPSLNPDGWQQWWRIVRARRLLAHLKQERTNALASRATCIQQMCRTYIARRKVSSSKHQNFSSHPNRLLSQEIGSASCRERVCQYV